ncbi:hypothetical protein ABLE91_08430 [Aquabacter sp. CN5-332]|uniref:lysozyme inhibitor LprI family protein n=1 Tax=Aquabacter sp. CN5-332 TaxID=3156608 RepID=UPI0032B3CD19
MKRVLALGLLGLALSASGASAASFNCKAAKAPDEKAICDSMVLSDLDVKMATLFDVATHLVAMGQRGALQDQQVEFLKARAACKFNKVCINNAYEARITALQAVLQSIYSRGPF